MRAVQLFIPLGVAGSVLVKPLSPQAQRGVGWERKYERSVGELGDHLQFFGKISSLLPTASPISWVFTLSWSELLSQRISSQTPRNSRGTPTIRCPSVSWNKGPPKALLTPDII